ncbi:MAG: type III secretion system chaperone [Planctomycetota bacterium]|jgi:hypothetical protein|nr:type III secretion system chaperone [Planctomycetota bacterium]
MTTYALIQEFIQSGRGAGFTRLDGEGHGVFLPGPDMPVHIFADAEDREDGGNLLLYIPVLSLVGAQASVEIAFLWRLAARNQVGAMPAGYSLFADPGERSIFLGGQFPPAGLDATAFAMLVEEFIAYAGEIRLELIQDLENAAGGQTPPAGREAPPASGWDDGFNGLAGRVDYIKG